MKVDFFIKYVHCNWRDVFYYFYYHY